jgi:hypothetical protein
MKDSVDDWGKKSYTTMKDSVDDWGENVVELGDIREELW